MNHRVAHYINPLTVQATHCNGHNCRLGLAIFYKVVRSLCCRSLGGAKRKTEIHHSYNYKIYNAMCGCCVCVCQCM